jgi:hypothetical protein
MTELIVSYAYKHDQMQINDLLGTIFNRELKDEKIHLILQEIKIWLLPVFCN